MQQELTEQQTTPPSTSSQVVKLTAAAQNYEWGRLGEESEVAKLMLANGQDIDHAKPYAELWMGTHPSGPSRLADGHHAGIELLAYIRDNIDVLGNASSIFGADLPFLFKVLSVRTALSIQSHPDKSLAERLHSERPNVYKDANHKPEMALALSDFQALCGFVSHEELSSALQTIPELKECCTDQLAEAYIASNQDNRQEALKAVFTQLMTADGGLVASSIHRMVERLQSEAASRSLTDKESLVLMLNDQYPGDVGVLAAWFLNLVTLRRGQAIYLAANEPHAYLSGEIVECMATSDNVVRAGLTPKLRDTDVLCSSLTYNQGLPAVLEGERLPGYECLAVYRPPFKEFEVWKFAANSTAAVELPASSGPMIALIQEGTGSLNDMQIHRGQVLFVPAKTVLKMVVHEDMLVWFAAANGMGFQ